MKPKSQSKEPRFEESLERLEALVQEMESGDLPLEEILRKYEEGNRLIQFCSAKLNEAEKRIEALMKEKDGSIRLKEFDIEEEDGGADKDGDEKPKGEKTDAKGEDNLF